MENKDLELGNANMIKNTVQRLIRGAKNKKNHQPGFSPSIFMVPSILRDVSPSCFDPRVVSIGPLHRGHKNVRVLEAWKSSYMINLMSRIKFPLEEIMNSCVNKVYSSMDRIKACYIWNTTYDDVQIAEMMVLDACFILEFTYQIRESDANSFIDKFLVDSVRCDLLLLENQIPFFILNEIFHCTVKKFVLNSTTLIEYIDWVVYQRLFGMEERFLSTNDISIDSTHHILSLLHQCYNPIIMPAPTYYMTTPSVMDLVRAGVNIKPNQNPTWAMEMKVEFRKICFLGSWCNPTLTMPILKVEDNTEFIFKNLIAYEQMCETGSYFTSYAAIMDSLVNTPADVAKLVDSGVIHNIMGSNEEAVDMINRLCKHVLLIGEFHYTNQCKNLTGYYDRYWPKHITKLRSTYFNNPWNIIALIAGILLFVLTTLQTIFTIMAAT